MQYEPKRILDGAGSYTVVAGDTLSSLARKNYGISNELYFPVILLASGGINDPDRIFPGLKIVIPDLKANLDNPGSRGKIKDFLNETADFYRKKGDSNTETKLRDLSNTL
jgi:phage tail protein X